MKKIFLTTQPLSECSLSILSFVLRLVVSGAMLTHGMAKVMNFEALSLTFPNPLGMGSTASLVMAIGAEVGCSLLLIGGILTRFAVLPLLFTMFVVIFLLPGSDTFSAKELPLLYFVIYGTIFALGSGKYSLDNLLLFKNKR